MSKMEIKEAIDRYAASVGLERLNVRAALIDMDGVLYDSMKNQTAAWYRMATEAGIECTREEFYLYEGMTGAKTINHIFRRTFGHDCDPDEITRLYALKAGYFTQMGEPAMMPGAARMLATLRDNGVKRVLVTGSAQQNVIDRISRDYPGMFPQECRVTARDVKLGKPNPEPYLMGAAKAGCPPTECMVVENAPLGIKAGKAAGAFVVGITTGPIPEPEMWNAGADLVFPSMPGFADALPDILRLAKLWSTGKK